MRELGFMGFMGALLVLGLKRPFLFILAYIYIDIVSPQRLTYILLPSIPVSMLMFMLAIGAWLVADRKDDMRVGARQIMMLVLLVYCGLTTYYIAEFQVEAYEKWDWASKALIFAIFLPLALRTKLRIEAVMLFMTLSLAAIIIGAGIKTALGGSGYGSFAMMVDNNSGIYEDSTLSTAAVMMIPIILYFTKWGSIFPPDWRVKLFSYALIGACLLTPIGTQARTGLVCAALLFVLMLRDSKRKSLFIGGAALAGVLALPFVPSAFSERMETIGGYQADSSASTRLAVWRWTFEFAQEHPLGGGFDSYRANRISVATTTVSGSGPSQTMSTRVHTDQSRAFHSSYFEMLGEQGWFGLALWLAIHGIGILRMEWLRRHYRGERAPEGFQWVSPLATALQNAHLVYLLGSLFVGIAYQPYFWILVAVQIGLDTYLARLRKAAAWKPLADQVSEPGTPKLVPTGQA